MKTFMKEFKDFITKGNVMNLAIGIIIGAAFTAIVNSLVADIITPLIGLALGGIDFTAIVVGVGDAQLMVGNFIQAIIMFILTALVVFIIVKNLNRFEKKKEEAPAKPSEEVTLLTEIRDALKK